MTVTAYTVTGMTCGHCASSVSEEIRAIGGVSDVKVDVPSGQVTVTSESPIEETAVKAAVEEAGYTLVGPA